MTPRQLTGPLLALLAASTATACEAPHAASTAPEDPGVALMRGEARALSLPEPIDLAQPPESLAATPIRVTESRIWPPCHELFEEDDAPRASLTFDSPSARSEALLGCGIEAHTITPDGRQLFAYALAGPDRIRARPQRLVAYDAQGALRWSHIIQRDDDPLNFVSSQRGAFILNLPPYLVCGGTRWEGSLEIACLRDADGSLAWSGTLTIWSGTQIVGRDKSLVVADISSLRHIYPWEGIERRSVSLHGSGGHAAYYATDGERLFFGANREPWRELVAYDLTTLSPVWRVALDERLDPAWSAVAPDHGLLFVKRGQELIAINTTDGKARWRVGVGDDSPPLASSGEAIYLLLRRAEGPNLLYELDPATGRPLAWGEPPTGTLTIAHEEGALLLKSVRAVQRAWLEPTPAKE